MNIFIHRRDLRNIDNTTMNHIKKWDKYHKLYKDKIDYPSPIVDHATRRDYALKKLKRY